MGCFYSEVVNEPLVPERISDKLIKTMARIEFDKKIYTGFFMKITINQIHHNFLLTCAHCISKNDIDSKITISIFYGKKDEETEKHIELDNNKRFIKCFEAQDINVTIIEILPEDKIPEENYLLPDLNYQNGYDKYIRQVIYTAWYPNIDIDKDNKKFSGGKILGFKNNEKNCNNFILKCPIEESSSGAPLININKNVIGVYSGIDKDNNNYGIFIGEIIEKINFEEDKIIKEGIKENEMKIIKFEDKQEDYIINKKNETINNKAVVKNIGKKMKEEENKNNEDKSGEISNIGEEKINKNEVLNINKEMINDDKKSNINHDNDNDKENINNQENKKDNNKEINIIKEDEPKNEIINIEEDKKSEHNLNNKEINKKKKKI